MFICQAKAYAGENEALLLTRVVCLNLHHDV
jgi:hypothetical protein